MKYFKELDTLRFFAVLLVIHQHWGPYGFHNLVVAFISDKILPKGSFGVDFFFVLSGFLITDILLFSKAKKGISKFLIIRNFIMRRALRIIPIYYLIIMLLFVLNYGDIRQQAVYLISYTYNFEAFHHNAWNSLGHTWTLSVEEQFYLVWPWVILFTPNKYLLQTMTVAVILSLGSLIVMAKVYGEMSEVLPWTCVLSFGFGGLYTYSLHEQSANKIIKKILVWLFPAGVILYGLNDAGIAKDWGRLADTILAVNIIKYVIEKRYGKFIGVVLNNKMLINMGKVSYGIYLYHYSIPDGYLFLIKKFGSYLPRKLNLTLMQPDMAEVIELFALFFISFLSYQLIEVNLLKYKRYFAYDKLKKGNFQLQ